MSHFKAKTHKIRFPASVRLLDKVLQLNCKQQRHIRAYVRVMVG